MSSNRKPEMPQSPEDVHKIVLEHLKRHRSQVDDKSNSLKAAGVKLSCKDVLQGAMVLELLKDAGNGEGEEGGQREKISSMIQGLVDNVQTDGERIVVVNVNTPAVDLQKDFRPDELNFIRDDIFRNIREQVGTELEPEVEQHWATAFAAIMDIVEKEKARK